MSGVVLGRAWLFGVTAGTRLRRLSFYGYRAGHGCVDFTEVWEHARLTKFVAELPT